MIRSTRAAEYLMRTGRPGASTLLGLLLGLALGLTIAPEQAVAGEPALPLEDRTVEVDGATIHYRVGGDGEPLLLLHGFVWAGQAWDPIIDELRSRFMVIAPDMRGHGQSTNPGGEWSYKQSAIDMFSVLDDLNLETVKGIGYSAGGLTLLHMAANEPARLSAMVVVAGGHRMEEEAAALARGFPKLEELHPAFLSSLRTMTPGGDDQLRALLSQLRRLADNPEDYTLSGAQLAGISTRTMLVWADRDEFYPMGVALELYQALPDASLMVLPGHGHSFLMQGLLGGSPHIMEQFTPPVVRFLETPAAE